MQSYVICNIPLSSLRWNAIKFKNPITQLKIFLQSDILVTMAGIPESSRLKKKIENNSG